MASLRWWALGSPLHVAALMFAGPQASRGLPPYLRCAHRVRFLPVRALAPVPAHPPAPPHKGPPKVGKLPEGPWWGPRPVARARRN